MSGSNTETETETKSGSPDQHPECVFDVDDLDIGNLLRGWYDNLEEWECSRSVWEEASGNLCVWHTSDGQNQEKPRAELEKAVGDGDLHGSAAIGVNLSGIDFQAGVDFIDADLSGADLSDADLSGADLTAADLPEANLLDADLSEASLVNADLSEANLSDADLSGADLSSADLSGANLRDADLSGADLSSADLSGAKLIDADLSEASLVNADLSGAKLINADLSDEANLSDADLSEASLLGADLSEASLRYADLSEASLLGADLSEAPLRYADLSEADLSGADLSGVDLSGADLSEADLSGADLSRADFRETQFSDITANQATTVGKTRSDFSTADKYDKLAKGYHNLKTALSEEGLSQQARQVRTLERHARTIEARKRFQQDVKEKLKRQIKSVHQFPSRRHLINMLDDDRLIQSLSRKSIRTQFTTWIGGVLSRLLTGYGTRPTFVLGWTGLILLLTTAWFELGPVPSGLEGGPLYYSVVTFVTSPPHPIQEVGEVGMITEIIVLLETYIGTTLIVLLGYVLGNRERV